MNWRFFGVEPVLASWSLPIVLGKHFHPELAPFSATFTKT